MFELKGRVFTGKSEGAHFLSIKRFVEEFKQKIGYVPFPGTLNLKLDESSVKNRKKLFSRNTIRIEGFIENGIEYGGGYCHRVKIQNKINGHAIKIDKTTYREDVLEIIAPVCLRKELKLKDGDIVKISFD
jgi:riboflavin kinase